MAIPRSSLAIEILLFSMTLLLITVATESEFKTVSVVDVATESELKNISVVDIAPAKQVNTFALQPLLNTSAVPQAGAAFILSLQWPKSVCDRTQPPCKVVKPHAFLVHGLWPQQPQRLCYLFDRTKITNEIPLLLAWWPNVLGREGVQYDNERFWIYEWATHGACSGFSQSHYFRTGALHASYIRSQIDLEAEIRTEMRKAGNPYNIDETALLKLLHTKLHKHVGLKCNKRTQLQEIRLYYVFDANQSRLVHQDYPYRRGCGGWSTKIQFPYRSKRNIWFP